MLVFALVFSRELLTLRSAPLCELCNLLHVTPAVAMDEGMDPNLD